MHAQPRPLSTLISPSSIPTVESSFSHRVPSPSSINKYTQPAICMWSSRAKIHAYINTLRAHSPNIRAAETCTWWPNCDMSGKERKRKRKSHQVMRVRGGRRELEVTERWKTLECARCQAESLRAIKPTIGPHRACVSVIRRIVCLECLSFSVQLL